MINRDGEDNWATDDRKNGPGVKEDKGSSYDGPAGMDVEGVIESNWDQVITPPLSLLLVVKA